MWKWDRSDWPKLVIEEACLESQVQAFHRAAERLAGSAWAMSDDCRSEVLVELMLSEAMTTSAIEGENLDRSAVRSSLRALFDRTDVPAYLGTKERGAASLIFDVRQKWGQPLTLELLGSWQSMSIPDMPSYRETRREACRVGEVRTFGGISERWRMHDVAPPASYVHEEMERFLEWYNVESADMAGPIRTTIAHLWFECIHPFDDGNGQVGRAIADHALSQAVNRPTMACLATAILETRKDYCNAFRSFDRDERLDIAGFAEYFASAIARSQEIALAEVSFVLDKRRYFDLHRGSMNARQLKAMQRMFEAGRDGFKGGMTTKKYMAINQCPSTTATRDLGKLCAMGALESKGAGRGTRYEIVHADSALQWSHEFGR